MLLLVEPILHEAWPALFEMVHVPIIYTVRFQTIRMSLSFEIHEWKCYENQLYILASRFEILLLREDYLFVLQELISKLLPDRRT